MHEPFAEVALGSADQIWEALGPAAGLYTPPRKPVFRGQASADWGLVPSVLREGAERHLPSHWRRERRADHQVFAELLLLRSFVLYCDEIGLDLPTSSATDFRGEGFRNRHELVEPEEWPGEDLLDLLAMAQHHKVPTRLLDWTRNPYAAIYFAASDALRQVADGQLNDRLAVWALDTESINLYREDVRIVRPSGSVSPHLAAQSGLFTVQVLKGNRDESLEVKPLETVFCRSPDSPLTKFTVPISESPRLVHFCERAGVSGARMFPSADGAGQAVVRNTDLWAAEAVLREATSAVGKRRARDYVRVGNWNVEWAKPGSSRAKRIDPILAGPDCDVLCVTEGDAGLLPAGGHVIDAGTDWGYSIPKASPGRRKVLLWSKRPWTPVFDRLQDELPGGRLVAGVTETPVGRVTVVGVCIPWRDAHVNSGRKDRETWQDHRAWLARFGELVYAGAQSRTIVLGDFNQRVPRKYAPVEVYGELLRAFEGLCIATRGFFQSPFSADDSGEGRHVSLSDVATGKDALQLIDHVAHSADFVQAEGAVDRRVGVFPKRVKPGDGLPDHFGVWTDLALA